MVPILVLISAIVVVGLVLAFVGMVFVLIVYELAVVFFSIAQRTARVIGRPVSFLGRLVVFLLTLIAITTKWIAGTIAILFQYVKREVEKPDYVPDPYSYQAISSSRRCSRFPISRAIVLSVIAPLFVMVVFLSLGGAIVPLAEPLLKTSHGLPKQILQKVLNVRDLGINVEIREFHEPFNSDVNASISKPKWLLDGDHIAGDVQRLVLSSQLWSTIEEAKLELHSRAAAIVDRDFEQRHREFLAPKVSQLLNKNRLEQVAVKGQYIEQVQMDFGPMNRLSWLIEISPMVRTELYSDWRVAKVQNRVIIVTLGFVIFTLIASCSWQYFQLRRFSHQLSFNRSIAITTGAFVLWASTFVIATSCLIS